MNDANHLLFVYGSLRSGFPSPAFQYIKPYFELVANGKVRGHLYDLGEYPAATPSTDERFIVGELYQAHSTDEFNWAISQLDVYEGIHPEEGEPVTYDRAQTTVYANDKEYTAWIYWYKGDVTGKPIIESGDVFEYAHRKNIL
jgi:gamma-glutamylcyclotransferase (GGCT)/AIG2-like uncharacterized protein YtfP